MKRKRPPITVLSVDWDYFLPHETDTCDWGHSEDSVFFYEVIWGMRATSRRLGPDNRPVIETLRIDPERIRKFWGKVLAPNFPLTAAIADSHKDIADVLSPWNKVRLINFDAHHDCGYHPKAGRMDCATWAKLLRQSGKIVDYHLVYPAWREQWPEANVLPPEVDRVTYGEWEEEPIEATVVVMCRSSCWMPPWCDKDWLQLRAGLLALKPGCVIEAPYIKKERPFVPVEFPTATPEQFAAGLPSGV